MMIKKEEQWRNHTQYKEKNWSGRKHLETFNRDVIKNKGLKFERDRLAFSEGKAY